MHDKMKAKACVDNKVNFTPPNYSKENFLATFSPQKQLTPEQLFWSQDIVKMKAEALKEQNTRPIKAFIGVIPFFKTLQEHFEGIQKALTKEVKEMSDAFDELEAELDQSTVDRKHDAIERKNLLLEHDNIIADCLLKEVFYVASNSELNVSIEGSLQGKDNVIQKLKMQISQFQETHSELDRPLDLRGRDFQISQLTEEVNSLQEQNELFRVENAKIKQHYKENPTDSIKIRVLSYRNRISVIDLRLLSEAFLLSVEGHDEGLPNLITIKGLQEQIIVMASVFKPLELQMVNPADVIKFLTQFKSVSTNCIFHQKERSKGLPAKRVVERGKRTLVEAARTMLIFSKAPMFLWAEAVATACYTQNRSLIHTRHEKTPYELVHDKKPDINFPILWCLCYHTNDSEDLGKLQQR
ncbi:retrovirus-related pol polyprotein from transposon TNT 1-94 [Tanacetum coccineum]